ncbi:hypothetical protein MNZ22_20530 [Aeromonas encheleia]|uniref:hypothetical protein n=1 Tax=Aeromonas encheleia TaxID=73010 RepID=UPI001F5A4DB1|nr:hypothetical protein [Aeromonas encheleia]UNP88786.1 hypothetical protein MNZ22_20530 [Aeromonas encheleia]
MNFEKYKCQEFMENSIGHTDPASFKIAIESYRLTQAHLEQLKGLSVHDARSLFYKALLSFMEATYAILNNHSSWSIVKLYYSVFYSLRVIIFLSGHVFFKDGMGNIYTLELKTGSAPQKVNNGRVRGDHKCTIKAYKTIHQNNDILNTNDIDGKNVFEWIMEYRELVNYRVSSFIEPDYGYDVIPRLEKNSDFFDTLIDNYLGADYLAFCFDINNSIYATPIVLLSKSRDLIRVIDNTLPLSDEKIGVIDNLVIGMGLKNSIRLTSLYK